MKYEYWLEWNKEMKRYRVAFRWGQKQARKKDYCRKSNIIELFETKEAAQERLVKQKEQHIIETKLDKWVRVE